MINNTTNNLFLFIEFLHSNIQKFLEYTPQMEVYGDLQKQILQLSRKNDFETNSQKKELKNKSDQLFSVINTNTTKLLKQKAQELGIYILNSPTSLYNILANDLHKLQQEATKEDLTIITNNINKYFEFRKSTDSNYFNTYFFNDLDNMLVELNNYFQPANNTYLEIKIIDKKNSTIQEKQSQKTTTSSKNTNYKETTEKDAKKYLNEFVNKDKREEFYLIINQYKTNIPDKEAKSISTLIYLLCKKKCLTLNFFSSKMNKVSKSICHLLFEIPKEDMKKKIDSTRQGLKSHLNTDNAVYFIYGKIKDYNDIENWKLKVENMEEILSKESK